MTANRWQTASTVLSIVLMFFGLAIFWAQLTAPPPFATPHVLADIYGLLAIALSANYIAYLLLRRKRPRRPVAILPLLAQLAYGLLHAGFVLISLWAVIIVYLFF